MITHFGHLLWLLCHTRDDLFTELVAQLDTSEKYARVTVRPDEESQSGDWRTSKGLPSDLPPTMIPLASNQSFEVDREATVCLANRRFFLIFLYSCSQPQHPRTPELLS
jgi:hypothetical protein